MEKVNCWTKEDQSMFTCRQIPVHGITKSSSSWIVLSNGSKRRRTNEIVAFLNKENRILRCVSLGHPVSCEKIFTQILLCSEDIHEPSKLREAIFSIYSGLPIATLFCKVYFKTNNLILFS